MQTLEYFYQNPPKNPKILNRKINLDGKKILLKGGINTGKTTFLIDFLEKFGINRFLYLNLDDLRLSSKKVFLNLNEFIDANNIIAIGFDGFMEDFDISCKCPNIIVSTINRDLKLDGFDEFHIRGLDYEEFISFYRKNYDARTLFSYFMTHGNGLKSPFLQDFEIIQFLQLRLKSSYDLLQLSILKELTAQVDETFNAYKVFKLLKQTKKISKDRLYENITKFEKENMINLISNFDSRSKFKKLYFSDFSLKNVLSFQKDPKKIIANMVFCELLKLDCEIYFTREIHFYLPEKNSAILVIPFSDAKLIFLRFKKDLSYFKKLGINKIDVISNANEASSAIEGIRCNVMPFWQWATSLE